MSFNFCLISYSSIINKTLQKVIVFDEQARFNLVKCEVDYVLFHTIN